MENVKECLRKYRLVVLLFLFVSLLGITKNVKAAERFLWPVPNYTNISQSYSDKHRGTDISQGGIAGKPVVATKSGIVVDAKDTCSCGDPYTPCTCNGRQGNYVIIKHNDGGMSRYLHLQYGSVSVRAGQSVNRGDQIGLVGSSGESYGYHLHFDLATGSVWNLNNRYDPMTESYDYALSIVNNPFGYLDWVKAEAGKITVHGWAADMDDPNQAIDVHFYAVQNNQRVGLGATKADKEHAGISTSYPALNNYHGFEATFNTGLYGDVQVEAYGINIGNSGSNVMLWEAPKTVNVPKDTELPEIKNVQITDLSASGYTVICEVSDNIGISSVQFPTWSHDNGQDDLIWHEGSISGNRVTCRINVSDHKGNVNCTYQTDVYVYDLAGNCKTYVNQVLPYIDAIPPTISDVEIVDVSESGYTVMCTVKDDHSEIDRVQFPTWFGDSNPFVSDASWRSSVTYKGKLENGKYVFRVNTSDYNNQIGNYTTHIYAWDVYGNQSQGSYTNTMIKETHRHEYTSVVKKKSTCTDSGIMLYTCTDGDDSYEKLIPATGHQHTELRNVKVATCTAQGYTGDTYCKDCGTKISSGKIITKATHSWNVGKITKNPTCTAKGSKTYICVDCGETKIEELSATGHETRIMKFAKEASCKSEGYTGDIFCQECGNLVKEGEVIPKLSHAWNSGEITKKATSTSVGTKTFTCKNCGTTKTETIASLPVRSIVGKTVKDKSSNGIYKILKNNCVEYTKPISKKSSVKVPDTIKISGKEYKVVTISPNAFKNNTVLRTIKIGKYVTTIGANAFNGCKKLSKISGADGVVKISYRAFYSCSTLASITIPDYTKTIGKQAFYNCKKLKNITIKSTKLTSKTVGSNAFTKTHSKPTVKVPAKKLKAYKKLLHSRGMSLKAVYKK